MEVLSQKRFTIVQAFGILAMLSVLQPAHGQRIVVESANVTVLVGQEAKILCRHNTALQYCRIEIPHEKNALVLSEKWDKLPMFSYNGDGLAKGHCGVTIKHANAKHDGTIKCYLGVDGEELTASVGLTVAVIPSAPTLEVLNGPRKNTFKIDEQFTVKCITRNGRPPSKLTWYLGEEQITDNLSPLDIQTTTANEQTVYTTSQTITRFIRASDDRKQLVCRAVNVASPTPQDAVYLLQVRYGPRPQPQIRVFGIVQGVTSLINVTILANPQPTIEWTVNGETIHQGSRLGRYEAMLPTRLDNGIYNVSLQIEDLTIEDTGLEYTLKAYNDHGTETYSVLISSSEATVISDVGLAVGLSIGAAALIIILAVIVIYVKKICCFAVSSNKSEKDAEGQMAPPHDDTDAEDYTDISKKALQTIDQKTGEKTAV